MFLSVSHKTLERVRDNLRRSCFVIRGQERKYILWASSLFKTGKNCSDRVGGRVCVCRGAHWQADFGAEDTSSIRHCGLSENSHAKQSRVVQITMCASLTSVRDGWRATPAVHLIHALRRHIDGHRSPYTTVLWASSRYYQQQQQQQLHTRKQIGSPWKTPAVITSLIVCNLLPSKCCSHHIVAEHSARLTRRLKQ